MKTIYTILFATLMLVVACDKNPDFTSENIDGTDIGLNPDNDWKFDIESVSSEDVDELLKMCKDEIDAKELYNSITSNGLALTSKFYLMDGEWRDTRMPGAMGVLGFVIRDNIFYVYGSTPYNGDEPSTFVCYEYDCSYDEATVTLHTKSKLHDFTYVAKAIYFKDNIVIFDGVLGVDDHYNDDYAQRRYIYICTLDSEGPAEWERLVDKEM